MSFITKFVVGSAAAALLVANAPASTDQDRWMSDYEALKSALEAQYANLTWFASPQSGVDLPALDRATRAALRQAKSEQEARTALLAFQSAFHDGHFVGRASLDPASSESPEPDMPDLKATDDAGRACVALGYAAAQVQFSLPIETLAGFSLATDGQAQPFRTGIMTMGSHRIGVVRVESFSMDNFPSLCRVSWSAAGVNQGGDVSQSALERAVAKAWYSELAARLRWLASQKVEAVLVDIGGNGGGDDSGDIATRLFTDRLVKSSPLLVKKGPSAKTYLAEQMEQVDYGLSLHPDREGARLLTQARGRLATTDAAPPPAACSLSWVWREQRPWSPYGPCSDLVQIGSAGGPMDSLGAAVILQPRIARRLSWAIDARDNWGAWTGPTYVFVDGRTASSAEMFAATLQNNAVARIVGVPSAGAGCGAMGPDGKAMLPATRLTFSFPTCVRLRPDGSNEVAGVSPDILVKPTQGESRRARAVRMFGALIADFPEQRGKR